MNSTGPTSKPNGIKEAIAAEIENSRLAHKIIPEFRLPEGTSAMSGLRARVLAL